MGYKKRMVGNTFNATSQVQISEKYLKANKTGSIINTLLKIKGIKIHLFK